MTEKNLPTKKRPFFIHPRLENLKFLNTHLLMDKCTLTSASILQLVVLTFFIYLFVFFVKYFFGLLNHLASDRINFSFTKLIFREVGRYWPDGLADRLRGLSQLVLFVSQLNSTITVNTIRKI